MICTPGDFLDIAFVAQRDGMGEGDVGPQQAERQRGKQDHDPMGPWPANPEGSGECRMLVSLRMTCRGVNAADGDWSGVLARWPQVPRPFRPAASCAVITRSDPGASKLSAGVVPKSFGRLMVVIGRIMAAAVLSRRVMRMTMGDVIGKFADSCHPGTGAM